MKELARPGFDPHAQVIVSSEIKDATPQPSTNGIGTVQFQSYNPKHILLEANAARAAVLLLNDRYDSDWRVRVDGEPAEMLRCNYLMRGVLLKPGTHTVEFVFQPPVGGLYLSLVAMGVSVLLLACVGVAARRSKAGSAENLRAEIKEPVRGQQTSGKA